MNGKQFPKSFGLKSSDWKDFDQLLKNKNAENPDRVRHILFLLARHGQGYHNIGEDYVGSKRWKRPSKLSPDKPIHTFFPDAALTRIGQHQADTLAQNFKTLLNDEIDPMPWPQAFYTSPLHRALETTHRTWSPNASGISGQERPYAPIVLETLREQIYIQHCNKRRTLIDLKSLTFPPLSPSVENHQDQTEQIPFDSIFHFAPSSDDVEEEQEDDEVFRVQEQSHRNETERDVTVRAYKALTQIIAREWNRQSTYISVTSHAGLMSAIYQVFGIRHVDVPRFPTGIVVPMLIRAEKIDDGDDEDEIRKIRSGDWLEERVDDHWDVDGFLGSDVCDEGRDEDGVSESLDEVFASIRDESVYDRLIERVERSRSMGIAEDEGTIDAENGQLNELQRLMIKALK